MSINSFLVNSVWLGSSVASHRRFGRALLDSKSEQETLLRRLLNQNGGCAYVAQFGMRRISSYDEFASRIPIIGYEELEPWVLRITKGEIDVLTQELITHFVPTSGSSSAKKLIPFSRGLQADFDRAIKPWVVDLYSCHSSMIGGTSYWSISPNFTRTHCFPESVVPIGFDSDARYLGGIASRLVEQSFAVPTSVSSIQSMEAFKYATLLFLLRRADLALVSVWHPSFFEILLEALEIHWDSLLKDIHDGGVRADMLATIGNIAYKSLKPLPVRSKVLSRLTPQNITEIWPRLRVVSCWGHSHAERYLAKLKERLPAIHFQPKGLIATEAITTIPFQGKHPLALRSHFFELISEEGKIFLAHEVQTGETYEVIVTTSGGLWRYRMMDRVFVEGWIGSTPCLRFIGRTGSFSDLFGEKLSPEFVDAALNKLFSNQNTEKPRFMMLAPETSGGKSRYVFYVEGKVYGNLCKQMEGELLRNPHYEHCRRLGQLEALQIFRITQNGAADYLRREIAEGMRMGDVKPMALSKKEGWGVWFSGRLVE
jgi:hypothetical protein